MFLVQKMSGSKDFWVHNDFEPKKFCAKRNLEFKEIWVQKIWLKTELSFKKTNKFGVKERDIKNYLVQQKKFE